MRDEAIGPLPTSPRARTAASCTARVQGIAAPGPARPVLPALLAVLAVLAAGVSGCGGRPPAATLVEPIADLAVAETAREVAFLDLGTPVARPSLGAGWSFDEASGAGTPFVWIDGGEAIVRFDLMAARRIELAVRAFPLPFRDAPPQALTVLVDGREAGTLPVPPGTSEQRLALGEVAAGRHRLTLRPAWHRTVREVLGGADPRSLGVGVEALRFDGAVDAGGTRPTASAGGDTLLLPFNTELSFFLAPAEGLRFAADAVSVRGAGRLELVVERDGAPARALPAGDRSVSGLDLDLSAAAGRVGDGPVRVAMRSVGTGEAAAAGIAVKRPRILGRALSPPVDRPSNPAAEAARPGPATASRSSVLLYTVDTLRIDRLGAWGHRRPVSPRLDALAARSTRFVRTLAQSSWTKPTMATLLTGLTPLRHGIAGPRHGLAADTVTLAEVLSAAGWRTAGASTNAYMTEASGFAQGFDAFDTLFDPAVNHAEAVTDWGLAWLDDASAEEADRPFFLWLHVIEPHAPYAPPPAWRQRFAAEVTDPAVGGFDQVRAIGRKEVALTAALTEDLLRLYDAEIAAMDAAFGRLLDGLGARGLADDTIVAFVADHGEAFGERDVIGHAWDLHTEVLDVPMLIHRPGLEASAIVTHTVEQIDLMPTLLDLLALPVPPAVEGISLVPWLDGAAVEPPERPMIAHMDYEGRAGLAVLANGMKAIVPRSSSFGPLRLYDLRRDPAERRDLAADQPVLAGWLGTIARRAELAAVPPPAEIAVDEETRKHLEALGYVN